LQSGDANLKRDFRLEAAVLLGAVQAYGAKPQSTTKLLNLLGTGDIGIISVTPQERQRLIGASAQIDRMLTHIQGRIDGLEQMDWNRHLHRLAIVSETGTPR
jgi:hypothetical protein